MPPQFEENSQKVIFHIRSSNSNLNRYFVKYVELLNHIYMNNRAPAYFELIEEGILWIVESFDQFLQMGPRSIQALNLLDPAIISYRKKELSIDLTQNFGVTGENLTFNISVSLNESDTAVQELQAYFHAINPMIQFQIISAEQFLVTFPTIASLVDYLVILFAYIPV